MIDIIGFVKLAIKNNEVDSNIFFANMEYKSKNDTIKAKISGVTTS